MNANRECNEIGMTCKQEKPIGCSLGTSSSDELHVSPYSPCCVREALESVCWFKSLPPKEYESHQLQCPNGAVIARSVALVVRPSWRKTPIALIMGYLQAMGSTRFVATAVQLFLFATLCTAKPQGFQTTGKLVCILGPTVSATSSKKNKEGAYQLVLQVKGDVYRCMEKRQGLLPRRRFRERDWPLGRPVQVLVDEDRGEVYLHDQRKHGKEVVLQCAERVSLESWVGCVTEH